METTTWDRISGVVFQSVQEVFFVVIQPGEGGFGAAPASQGRAVPKLLDVVQVAGDALAAAGVEGVEVDARPADNPAVQFAAIQDRLAFRVHASRIAGAVGADEPAVLIA